MYVYIKKLFNCVLQDYKMGRLIKTETARLQLVTGVVCQELQLELARSKGAYLIMIGWGPK